MSTESRSDPPDDPPPHSRRGIDAVAAQWVVRRGSGLDEAEECDLAAWIASDPLHKDAFLRLSEMAEVLQRARQRGTAGDIAAGLAVRARRRRTLQRAWIGAGSAAAVALLAGWWFRSETAPGPPSAPLAVRPFEPIRRLPDGSIVELDAQSEVTENFEPSVRRVELVRGEALFKVQKDPGRPFIVRAGGVEVRAVGTAFDVRLGPAAVEVFVTEGKVGVDDASGGESLLPRDSAGRPETLAAGQRAIVAAGGSSAAPPDVQVTAFGPEEIKQRLSWLAPRLEFDGLELARAVEQVNRRNREQIVIEGEAVGKMRISGNFAGDDPQTFSRLAAATFGLECERRGDGVIILRKK